VSDGQRVDEAKQKRKDVTTAFSEQDIQN